MTTATLHSATDSPEHTREDSSERRPIVQCMLCRGMNFEQLFSSGSPNTFSRCRGCSFVFLNPQPSDAELSDIYSESYFLGGRSSAHLDEGDALKSASAALYLDQIASFRKESEGKLLEVGSGPGEFLVEARKRGYEVTGIEFSESACELAAQKLSKAAPTGGWDLLRGELQADSLPESQFDVCVLSDLIEHIRNPVAFLALVRKVLKPGGSVFIATPALDSWSAALMGRFWMEYKTEHLTYFSRTTLARALSETGFGEASVRPGWKVLNARYIAEHFIRYPVPIMTGVFKVLLRILPEQLLRKRFRIVASGMVVQAFAKATPREDAVTY